MDFFFKFSRINLTFSESAIASARHPAQPTLDYFLTTIKIFLFIWPILFENTHSIIFLNL